VFCNFNSGLVDKQIMKSNAQIKAITDSKKVNFDIPEVSKSREDSKNESSKADEVIAIPKFPSKHVESEKVDLNYEVKQDTSPREALKEIFEIDKSSSTDNGHELDPPSPHKL
jgi:hypothetical protein